MAKSGNSEYLPDGSFDFSGGVDSSVTTTLKSSLNGGGLARSMLAWMNNATVRGGGVLQRTGWQPLANLLGVGGGGGHSVAVGSPGYWQGGFIYEPDSANPYLVFMVSGVLYRALLEPPYTLTDLTGGNPLLQNPGDPAVAEMAWFCQGENYLVIQAGDYYTSPTPTLPLIWNGTFLRRSIGITTAAPAGYLPNINEIPAATCMDYYGGRLWYAQGRQYSAGDMVGGPSGTLLNHWRDSILSVTENPLVLGGDGFTVPTNAGNIRALKHSANLNAALGQGQLFIFTRKTIYSLEVPVTRTDWINSSAANQPLQTVVQMVNGSVNDRSVVSVNGDLFYQSLEPAVRSLQVSVRNFGQWGNVPISQNEQRALEQNDRRLMRFSSGIQFDNRMLQLVLPKLAGDGVNIIHQAILPLDFDVVSNLSTQGPTNVAGTSAITPPVWEGAYDGLQFLQLFEGEFGGLHRAFALVISELDGSIGIWELTVASRTENGDNRVTWAIESPAYTWNTSGLELKLKHLKGGEIWVDKVFGTVEMDVYYREDADPCWRFWSHDTFCAARNCQEREPVTVCYPPQGFREGYKFPIVKPEPKAACDSMGVRPTTIGYQFQVKILVKGWCRIRGLILYAVEHTEPQYHGLVCQSPPVMAKIPSPAPVPPIVPAPTCPTPLKATNPYPANGQMNVDPRNVVLYWEDGGDSTSFNVVVFGWAPNANQALPSLALGDLLPNTEYTWRVDSINACGTTVGDTWTFTTGTLISVAGHCVTDSNISAVGAAVPVTAYTDPPNRETANSEMTYAAAIADLILKLRALGCDCPPMSVTIDPMGLHTTFTNTSSTCTIFLKGTPSDSSCFPFPNGTPIAPGGTLDYEACAALSGFTTEGKGDVAFDIGGGVSIVINYPLL